MYVQRQYNYSDKMENRRDTNKMKHEEILERG